MSARPTLHDFIDDELLRAPLTLDQVIDAVHEQWRLHGAGAGDGRPDRVLQLHRDELVAEAARALRQAVLADVQRAGEKRAIGVPTARSAPRELSLIGDDDVAVDIEIAHGITAVKQRAEAELRELQTFTSALVGDLDVSRDTNPFRPDLYVHAFWQGVCALPLSRAMMVRLMRDAVQPLAETLCLAYAAASARLEEQGVTPAAHRTIIPHGAGSAWGSALPRLAPEALSELRDSLHAPLDKAGREPTPALSAVARPTAGTTTTADPQSLELLSRLFDAIQVAHGPAQDTAALLQRLQPAALRVALHDPTLLEDYDHAVWRFMDELAHGLAVSAPSERPRLLAQGRSLVELLADGEPRDVTRFDWARARLAAHRRHLLAQAQAAAAAEIERLERIVRDEATPATVAMPLDVGSLDTIPADLMNEPGDSTDAAFADGCPTERADAPGDHWRLYLQGDWRQLQLLWHDAAHELWLLDEPASGQRWALRMPAIERLRREGLALPFRRRSLVRRAATDVLRSL